MIALLAVLLVALAASLSMAEAQVRTLRNRSYFDAASVSAGDTTLDLYLPAAVRGRESMPRPILIFVHGGGWQIGDKRSHAAKGEYFASQGFTVATANYRMLPDADVATQAQDVARAVAWMAANAAMYGADPTRIFLMGHSAGAHLAALVALDSSYLRSEGLPTTSIAGLVLLDGAAYDLVVDLDERREPRLMADVFGRDRAARRNLSPRHQVAPGRVPPPFLILHIPRSRSTERSRELEVALRAVGGRAMVVEAPGDSHRDINVEMGDLSDAETKLALEFLRSPG